MTFLDRLNEFNSFNRYLEDKRSIIFETLQELEGKNTLALQKFVDSLSYTNGVLDPTQDYSRQLLQLRKDIAFNYSDGPLRNSIFQYIDSIPEILFQNAKSIAKVNGLLTGELINPALAEEYALRISSELSVDVYSKEAIQPMVDTYRKLLNGNTKLNTLREEIETAGGRPARYAKQIVMDSQRTMIGDANNTILKAYELDGIIYEGGTVDDSRPLCLFLTELRRVIGQDELKQWLNADKYPEFQEGLMPGTNANNFVQRVGGYNCRHHATPVRMTTNDKKKINKYWGKEIYSVVP